MLLQVVLYRSAGIVAAVECRRVQAAEHKAKGEERIHIKVSRESIFEYVTFKVYGRENKYVECNGFKIQR
jgi:hypothetical protein